MAQPSGSGYRRRPRHRPGNGAAPGATRRRSVRELCGACWHADAADEPEDIANAVVFLASPESGWITAQVLTVDGGRMDYIGHG